MPEDQTAEIHAPHAPSLVEQCRTLDPRNDLYVSLLHHPQLVQVAGGTGQFKSALLANIGIYAASLGLRVLWLMGEMQYHEVNMRLWAILCGIAPQLLRNADVSDQSAMSHVSILELPSTASEVIAAYRDAVLTAMPGTVILGDNFDALPIPREDANALTAELADAAGRVGFLIFLTSQVKSAAEKVEIVQKTELAFSSVKTHPAGIVITLGPRVLNKIITVCVGKDRHRVFGDRRVRRLYIEPSLRLLPEPNTGMIHTPSLWANEDTGGIPQQPPRPGPPVRINERPGDFDDQRDGDEENQFASDADQMPSGGGMKIYHGTKGFIQINREVFASAAFKTPDKEALWFLLVLFEHAAIEATKLDAPDTGIPVHFSRGELMTSERMLANELRLTEKKVRGLLKRLERDGLIRREIVLKDGTRRKAGGAALGEGRGAIASVIKLCHFHVNKPKAGKKGARRGAAAG